MVICFHSFRQYEGLGLASARPAPSSGPKSWRRQWVRFSVSFGDCGNPSRFPGEAKKGGDLNNVNMSRFDKETTKACHTREIG
jgi:hypothetical protein